MREGKMKNKVEVTKQHKCIHHWIIDAPDAPTSYGKCKRCGEVAEFYNTYTSDFVNRAKLADEMPILAID
jgi:hypothetical protein